MCHDTGTSAKQLRCDDDDDDDNVIRVRHRRDNSMPSQLVIAAATMGDDVLHEAALRDNQVMMTAKSAPSTTSGKSPSSVAAMTFRESAGSVREAMIAYIYCYRNGTVATDMLTETVNMWTAGMSSVTRPSRSDVSDHCTTMFVTCPMCRCFLHEPITLHACGHTFCRRCLLKSDDRQCVKCRAPRTAMTTPGTHRVSVVLANVLQKWWPRDSEAARLKHLGNELFEGNDMARAIHKYDEAYELDRNDVVLLSNRSHALLNIGKSAEALVDAESAVNVRPDWSEGSALLSLGRYEDAAVAYLQCLVLEPDNPTVVVEVVKVLHKFLSMLSCVRSTTRADGNIGSSVCWNRTKSPSVHYDSDSEEYGSPERSNKRAKLMSTAVVDVSLSPKESERLSRFIDRCQYEMERTKKMESRLIDRPVDVNAIDKTDLECTLCYRLFWEPVTTPCGHVFCRSCLNRCLDHFARCPLCKTSLEDCLARRRTVVTEILDTVMKKYIPDDYAERQKDHEEEMNELARVGHGEHSEMPIFVCRVGFPTIPCPLHVFEPRYRLLVRRCMESGSQQFGMCAALDGANEEFASYGTMLEVRNVLYLPDGRSVLDTVGRSRFHVLQRGEKDGYHTAKVESLRDRPEDNDETISLHDSVLRQATAWFGSLTAPIRSRIVQYFGAMPDAEEGYLTSPDGPAWTWWTLAVLPLDQRAQLAILATKSLKKRLEALQRTLDHVRPLLVAAAAARPGS